jgi:glycosyltransferase involved in cell wall biosynthesis
MSDEITVKPLISICIPAYKRPENIRRLLNSIHVQTFRDFEIIITDDSPDDSVRQTIAEFPMLAISYYHNKSALGTPANWNYGISLAKGTWIKLMHDDDWFSHEKSLQSFAEAVDRGALFIVSRYRNVFESGRVEEPAFPDDWKEKIISNPLLLLAKNVIGPPSVTLIHHSIREEYDVRMKWRVDIDFYVRLLLNLSKFHLVDDHVVNVGISTSQVTNNCINMPEVELPEGILMLQKYGIAPLRNILVYDAWWRILRNVKVRSTDDLTRFTPGMQWPVVIVSMVKWQKLIPHSILKIGVISKLAMGLSFLQSRSGLR